MIPLVGEGRTCCNVSLTLLFDFSFDIVDFWECMASMGRVRYSTRYKVPNGGIRGSVDSNLLPSCRWVEVSSE